MSPTNFLLVVVAAVIFVAAAACAKLYVLTPGWPRLLGALALYTAGNLVVIRVSDAPPDEDHNYGHAKIEGLGAMFEGGFIFAAGGFLVYEAIHKAVIGEVSHDSAVGLIAMAPVLALTIGTVLYLRRAAAATGSLVLRANALHYLTDVYVNIGVVVALALVWLTGRPIIDTVIPLEGPLANVGGTLYFDHDKKWRITALLSYDNYGPKRGVDITRGDIVQALEPHLCRCGAHNRMIRAVQRAARADTDPA